MDPGSGATLSGESVMCGVCCNQLRRPKLLTCLHSVCLECLQNVWAGKSVATCPICSAPTDRDITMIQDNILMASLMSKLQLWQRIGRGLGIWCSLCQAWGYEEPATFLCFKCDHFLCLRCCRSHQLLTNKYGHQVKSLHSLKLLGCEEFVILARNETQSICPEHQEQQISFFCKTCSTSICCNCLLLHHIPQNHCYHDIKQEVMLEGEALKQLMDNTQESYNRFTDNYSELKSLKERMDLTRNEIEASIKQLASAIKQKIVNRGDRMLRELEAECTLEQSRLAHRLTYTEQTIKRMGGGSQLAALVLGLGTNDEMITMYEPIKSALTALQQAMPFDTSEEVTLMEFREHPLEARDLLGSLTFRREQRERVEVSETEEDLQEASENLQAIGSFTVKEESTTDGHPQHWCTEHNYSARDSNAPLLSPGRTEQVIFNISSDESQEPPAEKAIILSDDSEDDDGSLMPQSSKAPTNHGTNNSSGRVNGDWSQEGSSGAWRCQELRGSPLVFFQIQTTDVGENIVQLSAVSGEKIFNRYILPSKLTSAGAHTVDGSRAVGGVLYIRGEPHPACSLQHTMDSFLHFLQQLDLPLLVGHGIWTHDCQILCHAWDQLCMKDGFARCISGFLDTLWLAKKVLPKSKVKSFRLKHLVQALVGELVVPDVEALQKLYWVLKPTLQQADDSQFSLAQLEYRSSLQPLIEQKVIPHTVADKLAFEGISLHILQSAYQSDRKFGLRNLIRGSRNLGLHSTQKFTRAIRSFLQLQKCKEHSPGRLRT